MGVVTGCFHPPLTPLLPPPASGGGIRKGIITALPSREGRFLFDALQLAAEFFINIPLQPVSQITVDLSGPTG